MIWELEALPALIKTRIKWWTLTRPSWRFRPRACKSPWPRLAQSSSKNATASIQIKSLLKRLKTQMRWASPKLTKSMNKKIQILNRMATTIQLKTDLWVFICLSCSMVSRVTTMICACSRIRSHYSIPMQWSYWRRVMKTRRKVT